MSDASQQEGPRRVVGYERARTEDHAREGVGGLEEAGAREVVVDKALGAEAGEQALDDTLFEVKVDGIVGEDAGVFEDHGADGRGAPPIGERLVGRAGGAHGRAQLAAQLLGVVQDLVALAYQVGDHGLNVLAPLRALRWKRSSGTTAISARRPRRSSSIATRCNTAWTASRRSLQSIWIIPRRV